MRELLRYRRELTKSQAAERNRLPRLLKTANIRWRALISDLFGVSGRAMLQTLIEERARLSLRRRARFSSG